MEREELIPKHGGYRKLKSFQIAQLIYDLTVRFCERYVDKFNRTRDQMVRRREAACRTLPRGARPRGHRKKRN